MLGGCKRRRRGRRRRRQRQASCCTLQARIAAAAAAVQQAPADPSRSLQRLQQPAPRLLRRPLQCRNPMHHLLRQPGWGVPPVLTVARQRASCGGAGAASWCTTVASSARRRTGRSTKQCASSSERVGSGLGRRRRAPADISPAMVRACSKRVVGLCNVTRAESAYMPAVHGRHWQCQYCQTVRQL